MAYKEVSVKYVDIKGEKGAMSFRYLDTLTMSEALIKGGLDGLTGAQMYAFTVTSETAFVTPTTMDEVVSVQNDKDFKLHLVFDWPAKETRLNVAIPCPLINVEGGIVVRWGERKAFVPKGKTDDETGLDGDALAAQIGTMVAGSASALVFSSGSLRKR